jgi:hypothetical protein
MQSDALSFKEVSPVDLRYLFCSRNRYANAGRLVKLKRDRPARCLNYQMARPA